MGFWKSMRRGAEAGVAVHGEEVLVGELPLRGVVEPVEVESRLSPGGTKLLVGMVILMDLENGAQVADGDPVTARGFTGKVDRRMLEGAVWRVMVGPDNRWDEAIPGV